MKEEIIRIDNLSKSFGEVKAVQGLGLRVKRGELFAFLGVNGAGKSTTISVMCGALARDGGTVTIDGADIDTDMDSIKSKIGVVFQSSALDKQLSVLDNLRSRASLYGICGDKFKARLKELCGMLELDGLLRRPLGKLSGGQRRRIDIARALLHEPKLLILDEPTTGLDPQSRKTIWSVLDKLRREQGLTVFLTTHYMEEAADADYVVIIANGKKAAEGTPLELKNKYTGDFISLYNATAEQVNSLGVKAEKLGDTYRISVPDTAAATALITAHPDVFVDYEVVKGKMDDVFLAVTGTSLGGA